MLHYIDDGETLRLDGVSIPKTPGNRHYDEALAAVEAGEAEIPPAPGPTLEEYRATALATVRAACEAYIVAAYPVYKQLNILRLGAGYTQADLDTMNVYIDEARVISNGVETMILAAPTIDEINTILAQAKAQYENDIPV